MGPVFDGAHLGPARLGTAVHVLFAQDLHHQNYKINNMNDRIISAEIVLTDTTTNQNIATIMQQVALLIYADVIAE